MQIQKYRLSNGYNHLEFPPGTFFTNRFEIQRDRFGGESLVTWVMVPTEDNEQMEGEPLEVVYFVANTGDKFLIHDEVNGIEMFYEDTAMNASGSIVKHIFSVNDHVWESEYTEHNDGTGISDIYDNGAVVRIIEGKSPEEVRRVLSLDFYNLFKDYEEAKLENVKLDMSDIRPTGEPFENESKEPERNDHQDVGDWFNSLQGMPPKKS